MAIAANTRTAPFVPSVYVKNTYGADIGKLGAREVTPAPAKSMEVDVKFRTMSQLVLADALLRDTVDGVTLEMSSDRPQNAMVHFTPKIAADAITKANLEGVKGASVFDNTLMVFIDGKQTADRLSHLLNPTILGAKLQFEALGRIPPRY